MGNNFIVNKVGQTTLGKRVWQPLYKQVGQLKLGKVAWATWATDWLGKLPELNMQGRASSLVEYTTVDTTQKLNLKKELAAQRGVEPRFLG